MHLLAAQRGAINEGDEAVDLGQSPAELIVLSAADTELASLAQARRELGAAAPQMRLANLMRLAHPMSVDLYAHKTLAGARLVVVRVLGGVSYWAYGLETLAALARNNGFPLAVLPGDDKADPGLVRFSTLDGPSCRRLHAYLAEGGPANARNFLLHCRHLIGRGEPVAEPTPLLRAGLWHPRLGICGIEALRQTWRGRRPVAAICFYRALVQSGGLAPIEALVDALDARGLDALPVFVASLKDAVSVETVRALFGAAPPDIVLNATGFAVSSPGGDGTGTVLDENGTVVLQVVLAGTSRDWWAASSQGLAPRDLAMNVALPEVDGRVLTRAVAFKHAGAFDAAVEADIVSHRPEPDRVAFVADLAANWVRLRRTPPAQRRVALVMANYPNRDGRLANGVGLDTPAGTVNVLAALRVAGYDTGGAVPADGDALIRYLAAGPTNAACDGREIREGLALADYADFFLSMPDKVRREVTVRWGEPEADPFFDPQLGAFALPACRFGHVVVAIQPARGYNIDPKGSYHSPDLAPPHGYLAFHAWLRGSFRAHAVVHMGKHGNLEWLPGKALALSAECYPEAALGALPNLYPFIVNDPGEGSQAKRRAAAVIIDHLTPPLTRAESYGPLRDLEALVDEYYEASGGDPRRLKLLSKQILDLVADAGLDADAGIAAADGEAAKLAKLDAYLCELKEMQIRDGLHVFGEAPRGRLMTDLAVALARVPRGDGAGADASLQRSIAVDLAPPADGYFDPLDCDMGAPWAGPRPAMLASVSADPWRSNGDTVERIELLAAKLVSGEIDCPAGWTATRTVLDAVRKKILPVIERCGPAEMAALLAGLDGRFVRPGPSGAPTRGRLDVLPTGRNFYSVDCRAVPTPAAWQLGRQSAELLIARYRQDHGEWPTAFGLSVWGTANMRTGGDDIAQALALIGARPVWDHASRRLTGYEVATLAELGRPRVDVTLRISGFFRDAFPAQIELFDRAARAVGALAEEPGDNPIAARMAAERAALRARGVDDTEAARRAGYRVFGSKPGAYGAGLQALIDEKGWADRGDLAAAYLAWGSYAYGAAEEGVEDRQQFTSRLSELEAVVHNQDNREHDLLDSDDYYQFEGGMAAAVEHLSGHRPAIYHNDHSRPERPVVRALEEEIARVVRGRAANPKWIAGVMRHGYKGAFEMAATLDYLFAFAATTGAVRHHHFDLVYEAWLGDAAVRGFIGEHNPAALKEMAERFLEALERGLWTPRSNSARLALERLARR
ncbi:MAG: cobaltochelatase subunit CobN [Alphaproteobacteria bacterium]|nr:MAG: cobaltochelatase subunit CobN [Alphaproteobacteria bacterium]